MLARPAISCLLVGAALVGCLDDPVPLTPPEIDTAADVLGQPDAVDDDLPVADEVIGDAGPVADAEAGVTGCTCPAADSPPATIAVGAIARGDFNRDGCDDVLVAERGSGALITYFGSEDASLACVDIRETVVLGSEQTPIPVLNVVVADFSGDGYDDAIALGTNATGDWLLGFTNDGTGIFDSTMKARPLSVEATTLETAPIPSWLVAGPVDGGAPDVVVGNIYQAWAVPIAWSSESLGSATLVHLPGPGVGDLFSSASGVYLDGTGALVFDRPLVRYFDTLTGAAVPKTIDVGNPGIDQYNWWTHLPLRDTGVHGEYQFVAATTGSPTFIVVDPAAGTLTETVFELDADHQHIWDGVHVAQLDSDPDPDVVLINGFNELDEPGAQVDVAVFAYPNVHVEEPGGAIRYQGTMAARIYVEPFLPFVGVPLDLDGDGLDEIVVTDAEGDLRCYEDTPDLGLSLGACGE